MARKPAQDVDTETGVIYQSTNPADWDSQPVVEGVVVERDKMKVGTRLTEFVVIEGDEGRTRVFESAALEDAFKVIKVGHRVSIKFLRMVDVKGKKGHTFRQFSVRVTAQ